MDYEKVKGLIESLEWYFNKYPQENLVGFKVYPEELEALKALVAEFEELKKRVSKLKVVCLKVFSGELHIYCGADNRSIGHITKDKTFYVDTEYGYDPTYHTIDHSEIQWKGGVYKIDDKDYFSRTDIADGHIYDMNLNAILACDADPNIEGFEVCKHTWRSLCR